MANIFLSSDHHFGHKNIIPYCKRPFATIEEHDEALIQYWNETVQPRDVVIYLGDFSLSVSVVERVAPKLNGYKCIIPGNHDFLHPIHKPNKRRVERYEAAGLLPNMTTPGGPDCIVTQDFMYFDDADTGVHALRIGLCHLPFKGSSEDTRYEEWRPHDDGRSLLMHGHVHEKWKINGRMANVGVDVWNYRPVALETVLATFGERLP